MEYLQKDILEAMKEYLPEFEISRITHLPEYGHGNYYYDICGKKYLDFSSGIFTNTFGHAPDLVCDVPLSNIHGRHWSGEYRLYKEISEYLPQENDYCMYTQGNGGAYVVDRALEQLFYYFGKRKYNLVTFLGGFHGKTQGVKLAISKTEDATWFRSYQIDEPNCFRCPHRGECHKECITETKKKLLEYHADVFLFEPVLGSSVIVLPDGYLKEIGDFCRAHEIVLVCDEVLTGGGRTGSYFAGYSARADMITLTKGLANGDTFSLLFINRKILENQYSRREGNMLSTFASVPRQIELCISLLKRIKEDRILENVRERGAELKQGLERIKYLFPKQIGDVRSLGLMAAVEFVGEENEPFPEFGNAVFSQAEENGLELIKGGHILRLGPALNISKEDLKIGLNLLEKSIYEVIYDER